MRFTAGILVLLFVTPIAAQTAPKSVKTMRVEASPAPLYRVESDGVVVIDWGRVEAAAQSSDLANRDLARALLAVRDGAAK